MTDSFLIGVDGSESSHRAADFAAARARAAGARVVVA
jgi:nucleotide-binding universal stress UspA family protein